MAINRTLFDDKQGGPFAWRVVQVGEEGPSGHDSSETGDWDGMHKPGGYAEVSGCLHCDLPDGAEHITQGFIPINIENWFEDIEHRFRMLHRCVVWQKGLNADKLDCWDLDDILDWVAANYTTDHGSLSGLSDDDHTQYLLVDGTRAMTGVLSVYDQSDALPSISPDGGDGHGIRMDSTGRVSIIIDSTEELIVESGKVTIPGLLDPIGLEFTPTASNPGGTAANTLWIDSSGSRLKIGSNTVAYLSEAGAGDLLASSNLSDVDNKQTALTNIGVLRAVKTADESVSSSTTMQNDDHLSVTLEAGHYHLELLLLVEGGAAPDFKLDFNGGASSITNIDGVVSDGELNTSFTTMRNQRITSISTAKTFLASTWPRHIRISAGVHCGTGGTFTLRWAQNTSSGTAVTLKKGSWLLAVRAS